MGKEDSHFVERSKLNL